MEIEARTKQAAIRQNQRNALLASSRTVLSPMAALAVMTNRFTPPEIVLGMEENIGHKLRTRISSQSQFFNGGEEFAEREALPSSELIREFLYACVHVFVP
ncbi:hypothetical protein KIN20_030941 [Parelaphostrongylus tenuis]|uniref:Uncharacterized protein n=1 Tax=Parelaphostrongylus tenuis TaxID=148309 RepID=A0AAD5R4T3_PARTN|nr:hypothetical protein KIN20_030941 [Parelaphostrongylus tenuis]